MLRSFRTLQHGVKAGRCLCGYQCTHCAIISLFQIIWSGAELRTCFPFSIEKFPLHSCQTLAQLAFGGRKNCDRTLQRSCFVESPPTASAANEMTLVLASMRLSPGIPHLEECRDNEVSSLSFAHHRPITEKNKARLIKRKKVRKKKNVLSLNMLRIFAFENDYVWWFAIPSLLRENWRFRPTQSARVKGKNIKLVVNADVFFFFF